MKPQRHETILRAVETEEISTQEQLLACLRRQGIDATQATVSRDVKDLGLTKVKRGGRTVYALPPGEDSARRRRCQAVLQSAVLGVDGAGHIACVRCGPGMAPSACAALDAAPLPGVVGSLAGDDTIFLLCRGEAEMHAVCAALRAVATEGEAL